MGDASIVCMTRLVGRYSCAVFLACAAMGINGCGGAGDPGEGAHAVVQQLADEATERACGILAACCTDADAPYDEQACKAFHEPRMIQHFAMQTFIGAELDTAAAQRCMDSIGKVSDGCPAELRVGGDLPEACDGLFTGSVPLGGKCDSKPGHGCITSRDNPVFCDIAYDSESGKSVKPGVCRASSSLSGVHRSAGQTCSNTCDGGKHGACNGTGPGGNCYTSDGLFCSSESQRCEPQRVSGEPCDPVGSNCVAGTYCSSAGSDCEPGSACELDDFTCAPFTFSGEGEPCNAGAACVAGTYCDDSTCAPLLPLGAACSTRSQCAENNDCTAGTCQRPPRTIADTCAGQFGPGPSPGQSTTQSTGGQGL